MMNKISVTGRLAADAELRFTQGGDPILGFRVADDVGFGEKKTTNWLTCSIWGKRGESLAPHLTKGTPVTVFGTLTLREWIDKEGLKRMSPEIRIDEITMHGSRNDSGAQTANHAPQQRQQSAQAPQSQPAESLADMDSDVPF